MAVADSMKRNVLLECFQSIYDIAFSGIFPFLILLLKEKKTYTILMCNCVVLLI